MNQSEYDNFCLQVFRKVSELLNTQIELGGKLQKNNSAVWTMLHQMDNDIWRAYLRAIKILEKQFPHTVNMDTLKTVLTCENIITKYGDLSTSGNILTPYQTRKNGHNYKPTAWKMVQQGRETWNKAMNIDLPNDDSSKRGPKDDLFEF